MLFVPFERFTVALALMIVEMVPIGVGLRVGFMYDFLDDFLDDFVDELLDGFLDGFLVCSFSDLGLVGDLVKIFVDLPLFRLFIGSSLWVCPSMSSLSCCAGRLKGLALFDTRGLTTALVSFCNRMDLILFSLFAKAWGEITVKYDS